MCQGVLSSPLISPLITAAVRKGDLLVELDPRDYEADLASAEANLEAAKAQATALEAGNKMAQQNAQRYKELFATQNVSKQTLDQALTDARSATAHYNAALAAIKQTSAAVQTATNNLSYTKIYAPEDGRVSKKAVSIGDSVSKNQSMTVLIVGQPWVIANFKETQITRMRHNQPVTIKVDAYPSITLYGHVDSIQPGTGSRFSLMPPENATGNFIKVVQRIPVKIIIDPSLSESLPFLAPGMSVTPTIDTKDLGLKKGTEPK